jgi:hypothetical protein
MTTDVSMSPRGWRGSATRTRSLVENGIDVITEPLPLDRRCTRKSSDRSPRADELTLSKRCQLTDGNPVARDDEGLAAVERPHDLAALIP